MPMSNHTSCSVNKRQVESTDTDNTLSFLASWSLIKFFSAYSQTSCWDRLDSHKVSERQQTPVPFSTDQ